MVDELDGKTINDVGRGPLAEPEERPQSETLRICLAIAARPTDLRLRDRQPGLWGAETLRRRPLETLSLAGLPLLPGEQRELFTEPIISSATQSQT